MPDAAELLAAYDAQVRARVPERLPAGAVAERDGPLTRFVGFALGGFVVYRDLDGLDGAELEQLLDERFGIEHTTLQVDHSRAGELLTISRPGPPAGHEHR